MTTTTRNRATAVGRFSARRHPPPGRFSARRQAAPTRFSAIRGQTASRGRRKGRAGRRDNEQAGVAASITRTLSGLATSANSKSPGKPGGKGLLALLGAGAGAALLKRRNRKAQDSSPAGAQPPAAV